MLYWLGADSIKEVSVGKRLKRKGTWKRNLSEDTAEIAIQRKLLSDYIGMVEQAAVCADPELYSYILKAVTEGTTFVVLKSLYGIPCERDMFYDRRRKFYWVLSGVR